MGMPKRRELQPAVELTTDTKPDYQDNVDITVGLEGTNTIEVSVAVKDMNEDLEEITPLEFFITDASDGEGTITAVDSESITTGTEIEEIVNHAHYKVLTDSSGDFVIELTKTGDSNLYMGVIYKGRLFMSDIIAFTS